MVNGQDRILIVENDPLISDLIGRQTLQAAGYQVFMVNDASTAISRAIQMAPDVIIANINLPGLSGKDLMVALFSQGITTPVIMVAPKGMEADIIQTFRLGAADYLLWPAREPEILSAVERILKQVHEHQERDRLERQLQQTNRELQQRVRELTTIFSMGKAVTSITDQAILFEKLLENVTKATHADLGWFLLRDESSKGFLLVAQQKLPASLPVRLNQPWDDGISSLVAMSGEPLSIHGEPLKRFKIAGLGQSALIMPIKAAKQVIGILVLMRKAATQFTDTELHLVGAIADFASISMVNARLFRALEDRARQQQLVAENALSGEKITNEILERTKKELRMQTEILLGSLNLLTKDPTARWNPNQRQSLTTIQETTETLLRLSESISPVQAAQAKTARPINLNDLLRLSASQFLPIAQQSNLSIITELPNQPIYIQGEEGQLSQAINGLISNAVKFCNAGGHIRIQLEKVKENQAHITIADTGPGIDQKQPEDVFDNTRRSEQSRPRRFGGLGISTSLTKEIISRQGGRIWVESKPAQGTTFHITLAIVR